MSSTGDETVRVDEATAARLLAERAQAQSDAQQVAASSPGSSSEAPVGTSALERAKARAAAGEAFLAGLTEEKAAVYTEAVLKGIANPILRMGKVYPLQKDEIEEGAAVLAPVLLDMSPLLVAWFPYLAAIGWAVAVGSSRIGLDEHGKPLKPKDTEQAIDAAKN